MYVGSNVSAPEIILYHPNRDRAESQATRAATALLLFVSAAMMALVLLGGWTQLAGQKVILIGFIVAYVGMGIYTMRWNRGVLPVAISLAIILVLLCLIAAPSWFARSGYGYAATLLPATLLGLITYMLIPVQALLIAFAARGFRQQWHVEIEREAGELPPPGVSLAEPHPV